jgi:hypothetical protein
MAAVTQQRWRAAKLPIEARGGGPRDGASSRASAGLRSARAVSYRAAECLLAGLLVAGITTRSQ